MLERASEGHVVQPPYSSRVDRLGLCSESFKIFACKETPHCLSNLFQSSTTLKVFPDVQIESPVSHFASIASYPGTGQHWNSLAVSFLHCFFRYLCTLISLSSMLYSLSWFQLGHSQFFFFIVSGMIMFWLQEKNNIDNTLMFLVVPNQFCTDTRTSQFFIWPHWWGVLCSDVESSKQERHRSVGAHPE